MSRWTDENLAKLTARELTSLAENVRARVKIGKYSAEKGEALCARIEARHAVQRVDERRARQPVRVITPERRIAARMGEFAREMAAKYDLTEASARRRSTGTKNFRPHVLTTRHGEAKSGVARQGVKLPADRYLSYRVGDTLVMLSYLQFEGQLPAEARYYVIAPAALLQDGQRYADVLGPNKDYGWTAEYMAGMHVVVKSDLNAAGAVYDALLAKVAEAAPVVDAAAVVAVAESPSAAAPQAEAAA